MEAFAWLVARGLSFWFAALIEMEWTDEEVCLWTVHEQLTNEVCLKILETLDRVNQMEMDKKLLDRTIIADYNKLAPTVQTEIAKKRPKIKQIILDARRKSKWISQRHTYHIVPIT